MSPFRTIIAFSIIGLVVWRDRKTTVTYKTQIKYPNAVYEVAKNTFNDTRLISWNSITSITNKFK